MLYRLGLSGTHTAGLELMALLISAPKQWDGGWGTTIPGLSLALLKDAVILNQCFVFNHGEKHYFELLKCTVLVKSSRNIGKKGLLIAVATESHHGGGRWKWDAAQGRAERAPTSPLLGVSVDRWYFSGSAKSGEGAGLSSPVSGLRELGRMPYSSFLRWSHLG